MTLVRDSGHRVPASVEVHLEPGGGATPDVDYEDSVQTVRFSATQTRRTVTLRTLSDDEGAELNESFTVVLKNAEGAHLEMGRRYSGVPGSRLGVEPMRAMATDTMGPGASGMDLHGPGCTSSTRSKARASR